MKRIVLLIVLLMASVASAGGYYHGQKFTHDGNGNPYRGGYYRYNSSTYKFDWYDAPSTTTTTTNYNYSYTWNNASANAGASQSGLQGAFRYQEYDVGADIFDSQHYVASARSIDERRLDNQRVRDVQAGYTRDRLLSIQEINAKTQLLQSLDTSSGRSSPQVLQQFNNGHPQPHQNGDGQFRATVEADGARKLTGGVAATEAQCRTCHGGEAVKAEGIKLPAFSALVPQDAERALDYITRLDDRNCAKRAQLTVEAHRELRQFFESLK